MIPRAMPGSSVYSDADLAAAGVGPEPVYDLGPAEALPDDLAAVADSIEVAFALLKNGVLITRVRAPLAVVGSICGLVRVGPELASFSGPGCRLASGSPYAGAVEFELPSDTGETGTYVFPSTYVAGREMEAQLTLQVADTWLTGIWYYDGHGAEFWALPDVISDGTVSMLDAGELKAILVAP